MRHIGEEFALQPVRFLDPTILFFQFVVLAAKLFFQGLLLGDVFRDQQVADRCPVCIPTQRDGNSRRETAAALAHALEDSFGLSGLEGLVEQRLHAAGLDILR